MWGDNEVTNVFSAHLHCPCPEPKPRIPPFPPRLFARAAGKACDLTPGVFIKQLFAFLSFLFFFMMMPTRMAMPLSPFAAREAYLHMTLHAAIGETELCRVLFCWNDVLLSWM